MQTKKRVDFSLSFEAVKLLKELSEKTGLKMSTIVEKGIKKMEEELK